MTDRTPMQRALDRDTEIEELALENERLRAALPACDEPAFPYAERNDDGSHFRSRPGMSLRAYIATAAMQGLAAHGGSFGETGAPDQLAARSVEIADALLSALAARKEK